MDVEVEMRQHQLRQFELKTQMHCFPSAHPFKPYEKNREQDKTNHFSGCIVHPAPLISCKYVCEQYVFG